MRVRVRVRVRVRGMCGAHLQLQLPAAASTLDLVEAEAIVELLARHGETWGGMARYGEAVVELVVSRLGFGLRGWTGVRDGVSCSGAVELLLARSSPSASA